MVKREYGIELTTDIDNGGFDAAILAVSHEKFRGIDVENYVKENHVIFDVKSFLDRGIIDGRL